MQKILTAWLTALLLVTPALSHADGNHLPAPRFLQVAADEVALDSVVSRLRQNGKLKVLRAETRNVGGQRVHIVKVLGKGGKVRVLRFNASNGRKLQDHR